MKSESTWPAMPQGAQTWAYGHDGFPCNWEAPKGLGSWERDGNHWIYLTPQGLRERVSEAWKESSPPPLPRPESEWTRCGCREREHMCSACGRPYWVEFHGVADGSCTYCYHRG